MKRILGLTAVIAFALTSMTTFAEDTSAASDSIKDNLVDAKESLGKAKDQVVKTAKDIDENHLNSAISNTYQSAVDKMHELGEKAKSLVSDSKADTKDKMVDAINKKCEELNKEIEGCKTKDLSEKEKTALNEKIEKLEKEIKICEEKKAKEEKKK